jgi:hypothetical protein
MPLMSMSHNVQELDPPGRKRTHTECSDVVDELSTCDSTKPQPDLSHIPSKGQYRKKRNRLV